MHKTRYTLLSVQTGTTRKVRIQGRSVATAIFKTSTSESVPVGALGLVGDEQADPTVHGGLDKAVYAYPSEHYSFWREARAQAGVIDLGSDLTWGAMGENLSLQGLMESDVWLGDVLRFPACTLRVTQPREPCFKFNAAMGFTQAVREMAKSGFCGFYLAVDEPGVLKAGEPFALEPGPRRVSVPDAFHAKVFKNLR